MQTKKTSVPSNSLVAAAKQKLPHNERKKKTQGVNKY
jgi:hypothetical protein